MDYETLLYSLEDGVATVTINRPERMNSLGASLKPDLWDLFTNVLVNERGVRCVVLTGAGERAFCAGADIKERAANRVPMPEYFAKQQFTHDLFRRIETFERPVIAAINGVALGGGLELALCCDIRIAAEHALLGLTEVNLGALPAAGGTQRLPRLIGASAAKEMMFTGAKLSAAEAKAQGIVSRVVPGAELMATAQRLAREIAEKAPLSVSYIKHAVNAGLQVGIDEGLTIERAAAAMCISSEDRMEGFRAFLEKRKPVFRGV